jgi:hypothetical protein
MNIITSIADILKYKYLRTIKKGIDIVIDDEEKESEAIYRVVGPNFEKSVRVTLLTTNSKHVAITEFSRPNFEFHHFIGYDELPLKLQLRVIRGVVNDKDIKS